MAEEKKQVNKINEETKPEIKDDKVDASQKAGQAVAKSVYGGKIKKKGKMKFKREPEKREFDQNLIDIARVTRVMAGGKRMRFRACVAIGNKKGKVSVGIDKGADVAIAVNKAVNQAKKDMITVPIVNDTIPHEIYQKFGAAKILFKPARKGRGIIAGGTVRTVLELTGIKNITCKILGTTNKVNNAKCVIEALKNLKRIEQKKKPQENKTTDSKKEPTEKAGEKVAKK